MLVSFGLRITRRPFAVTDRRKDGEEQIVQKNAGKWIFFIIAAAGLILADQLTKYFVVLYLKGRAAVPVIPNVFEFLYVENTGAAFGIFRNSRIGFIIVSCVLLFIILYLFIRTPAQKRFRPLIVLFTFLAAGAAGNLIDRIRQGYVVDFIYFKPIDFPVFNVADCYITVSAIVLVLMLLFYYRDQDLKTWKKALFPSSKEKVKESGE